MAHVRFTDEDRRKMREEQEQRALFNQFLCEFYASRPHRVAKREPITPAQIRCRAIRDIRYGLRYPS